MACSSLTIPGLYIATADCLKAFQVVHRHVVCLKECLRKYLNPRFDRRKTVHAIRKCHQLDPLTLALNLTLTRTVAPILTL